jgi:hypothetical protein
LLIYQIFCEILQESKIRRYFTRTIKYIHKKFLLIDSRICKILEFFGESKKRRYFISTIKHIYINLNYKLWFLNNNSYIQLT